MPADCADARYAGGSNVTRIAFAATYPPRRCGIATFTSDLSRAVGGARIVALHYLGDGDRYPAEVQFRIARDNRDDYLRVARALDAGRFDAISLQHEYGIWGGEDGEYVLDFARALHKPIVTTLHTVPQRPTANQRRILMELVERSAATVVMSRSAARLLAGVYGVRESGLDVIEHGVPELPLVEPDSIKPLVGLELRPTLLSFGLIGPGKGYESVIEAMPEVAHAEPAAQYVILGATHPELIRREGEAYRTRLVRLAETLGVEDRVRFVDRYVSLEELGRWLEAADIFVTPYPNPDQIVSGTLSYAMSAGKPVVSTPYAYAAEMLSSGLGVLVEPGSPKAMAEALAGLLRDDQRRLDLGRRAYDRSRSMIWPAVGRQYREVFERVAFEAGRRRFRRKAPPVAVGRGPLLAGDSLHAIKGVLRPERVPRTAGGGRSADD